MISALIVHFRGVSFKIFTRISPTCKTFLSVRFRVSQTAESERRKFEEKSVRMQTMLGDQFPFIIELHLNPHDMANCAHIHKLHPFMLTYKCVIRSRREFLDYKTIKHHYEPLTTHSFTFIVHQTRTLRAEKKIAAGVCCFIIEVINDVPSAK